MGMEVPRGHFGTVTPLGPAFLLPRAPNKEIKSQPCCCSACTKETKPFPNATDTTPIDFFLLALRPLSPSYQRPFLSPSIQGEVAEGSQKLSQRMFLEITGRSEGCASPLACRPSTFTFRARRQAHLLTQDFASKGSSHRTDLSFEDASYSA